MSATSKTIPNVTEGRRTTGEAERKMATEMSAQTDSLDTSGPAALSRAAFGETELSRLASKASAGDNFRISDNQKQIHEEDN